MVLNISQKNMKIFGKRKIHKSVRYQKSEFLLQPSFSMSRVITFLLFWSSNEKSTFGIDDPFMNFAFYKCAELEADYIKSAVEPFTTNHNIIIIVFQNNFYFHFSIPSTVIAKSSKWLVALNMTFYCPFKKVYTVIYKRTESEARPRSSGSPLCKQL